MPITTPSFHDRATGALMGAFVGDALGLGPHWYYDLDELRANYGPWISDYTDPKPNHYHSGMKAGQLSQAGIILEMTLRSLVERNGYDEADFCRRMDEELFPLLNGEPAFGPGGYTSQSIRGAWHCRVEHKLSWEQTAGHADTTEAVERTLAIATLYAKNPHQLAVSIASNTALTQADNTVQAMTVAFGAVLGLLVQGHHLDVVLSDKLIHLAESGAMPFHDLTPDSFQPPYSDAKRLRSGHFASPDALLIPSYIAAAACDPDVKIEPAWKVSSVYGMPCAIYNQIPAAYYLAARFRDDFESAILHAINGGGQNQARAILTGALTGAQVGISGIPQRFIDGLEKCSDLLQLTRRLAAQASAQVC